MFTKQTLTIDTHLIAVVVHVVAAVFDATGAAVVLVVVPTGDLRGDVGHAHADGSYATLGGALQDFTCVAGCAEVIKVNL